MLVDVEMESDMFVPNKLLYSSESQSTSEYSRKSTGEEEENVLKTLDNSHYKSSATLYQAWGPGPSELSAQCKCGLYVTVQISGMVHPSLATQSQSTHSSMAEVFYCPTQYEHGSYTQPMPTDSHLSENVFHAQYLGYQQPADFDFTPVQIQAQYARWCDQYVQFNCNQDDPQSYYSPNVSSTQASDEATDFEERPVQLSEGYHSEEYLKKINRLKQKELLIKSQKQINEFMARCNRAVREQCEISGKEPTRIRKPYKLFKDDWFCSKCYNINYNYRATCPSCFFVKGDMIIKI